MFVERNEARLREESNRRRADTQRRRAETVEREKAEAEREAELATERAEAAEQARQRLTAKLQEQFKEGAKLEKAILNNLQGLGYGK